MTTSISIAVACTWFQRRLCWMLSSILQQRGSLPRIVVDVAHPPGNGTPTTEQVCDFFRSNGLDVRNHPLPMETIQYRGLARNDQLARCDTEWVLFADTDMVYDPMFFDDLNSQLVGPLKQSQKCMSARRVSLDKDFCKRHFNVEDNLSYPCVVQGAADIVSTWPVFQISKNVGAGYFQLANVRHLRENCGGIYVDPYENMDWSWDRMQKANSDRQFRRRCGGVQKISTRPQYHLNHERDNEAGEHLTLQR